MLLESLVEAVVTEAAKQDELILARDATPAALRATWRLRLEGTEIDVEEVE